MIMAGLELLGDIPFHDVIIHSTILAPDGRRMSKSLGTGIDPLEMIDAHGADATRYGLLKMSSVQDVRFSNGAVEEGRRLANKLWNASRLLLQAAATTVDARPSSLEERWILARIDATRAEVEPTSPRTTSRTRSTGCTTSRSTTSATGISRRSSRASREPDVQATALAALERLLEAAAPGAAARHRGDLVAPAGARRRG